MLIVLVTELRTDSGLKFRRFVHLFCDVTVLVGCCYDN